MGSGLSSADLHSTLALEIPLKYNSVICLNTLSEPCDGFVPTRLKQKLVFLDGGCPIAMVLFLPVFWGSQNMGNTLLIYFLYKLKLPKVNRQ